MFCRNSECHSIQLLPHPTQVSTRKSAHNKDQLVQKHEEISRRQHALSCRASSSREEEDTIAVHQGMSIVRLTSTGSLKVARWWQTRECIAEFASVKSATRSAWSCCRFCIVVESKKCEASIIGAQGIVTCVRHKGRITWVHIIKEKIVLDCRFREPLHRSSAPPSEK